MPQEEMKVTDRQISMILEEELRIEHMRSSFSWNKMTKALNAKGPCMKSATDWKEARLEAIKLKFIRIN